LAVSGEQVEPGGDVVVGQSGGDQGEDLTFAVGQHVQR
jgi:hypothetical protein